MSNLTVNTVVAGSYRMWNPSMLYYRDSENTGNGRNAAVDEDDKENAHCAPKVRLGTTTARRANVLQARVPTPIATVTVIEETIKIKKTVRFAEEEVLEHHYDSEAEDYRKWIIPGEHCVTPEEQDLSASEEREERAASKRMDSMDQYLAQLAGLDAFEKSVWFQARTREMVWHTRDSASRTDRRGYNDDARVEALERMTSRARAITSRTANKEEHVEFWVASLVVEHAQSNVVTKAGEAARNRRKRFRIENIEEE